VRKVQSNILSLYFTDIIKYAPLKIKLNVQQCLYSLPAQLTKENTKFQYSIISKNGNKKKYYSALQWLIDYNLITIVNNLTKIAQPLSSFIDPDCFKVYFADIGLFTSFVQWANPNLNIIDLIINHNMGIYYGAFSESFIADIIIKRQARLYYFSILRKLEIDYVTYVEQEIVAVEVKSSNNRTFSLDKILNEYKNLYGYKLISGNVGVNDRKITLPRYLFYFLK
jgi:predicted AAA+ superfamily ATPase